MCFCDHPRIVLFLTFRSGRDPKIVLHDVGESASASPSDGQSGQLEKELLFKKIPYWEVAPTFNLELFNEAKVAKILPQIRKQYVQIKTPSAISLNAARKNGYCNDPAFIKVLDLFRRKDTLPTIQRLMEMDENEPGNDAPSAPSGCHDCVY